MKSLSLVWPLVLVAGWVAAAGCDDNRPVVDLPAGGEPATGAGGQGQGGEPVVAMGGSEPGSAGQGGALVEGEGGSGGTPVEAQGGSSEAGGVPAVAGAGGQGGG